jgi:pimeloyl-ACP methyl ester carboxylesterase
MLRSVLHVGGYSSRWVETSVGRVHVLEAQGFGSLPDTVLLHGLGSQGLHYLPMLSALRSQVRRIILPDLPAHGFSALPPAAITAEVLLQGVTEALDKVLETPAIFFGNSLGGAVSIRYALASPRNVHGLVLASPAGAPSTAEEFRCLMEQFRVETHADAVDFIDRLFAEPGLKRHVMAWGFRRHFAREELQAVIGSLVPEDRITPDDLRRLAMPLLLLWGKADRILPSSHFDYYAQHLPGHALIEELDGVGHSPFLESPELIVSRLVSFSESIEAPTLVPAVA